MKLSVIVPVYNEQESVLHTIKRLHLVLTDTGINYEIIVVNDGSTDHSEELLKKVKGITLLKNPYNLGYGASLKKGIKNAKYDWIMITDADGTYPIEDIPRLLKHTDDYDMVVGKRTGKHVEIPLIRKPAKIIISLLVNFLTGRKIPDVNSGLRLFKRDIALEFFHLFPSGFSFTTTITLACFANNYTVKYIPINYYKRKGKSTIHPIKDFLGFISLIFRITIYFNPFKFFLSSGILVVLLGIIYGLYQVIILPIKGLGQLPVLLILGGLQIIFIGLLADLINKISKKQ